MTEQKVPYKPAFTSRVIVTGSSSTEDAALDWLKLHGATTDWCMGVTLISLPEDARVDTGAYNWQYTIGFSTQADDDETYVEVQLSVDAQETILTFQAPKDDSTEIRALRGIALLDKKNPGWLKRVDLSALDMARPGHDVLGLVYDRHVDGITTLFGVNLDKTEEYTPGQKHQFIAHGFLDEHGQYEDLQTAWRAMLSERLQKEIAHMNLDQALTTGKPFKTNFATNMERGWIKLFIEIRDGAYHLECVYDITEDPLILDTESLPILKSFLQVEQGIDLTSSIWIESKGSPPASNQGAS